MVKHRLCKKGEKVFNLALTFDNRLLRFRNIIIISLHQRHHLSILCYKSIVTNMKIHFLKRIYKNLSSLQLISSLSSSHTFNINYIYSLLFLLQLLIHPNISQSTTEPNDTQENDGQYTNIYLTMYVII